MEFKEEIYASLYDASNALSNYRRDRFNEIESDKVNLSVVEIEVTEED